MVRRRKFTVLALVVSLGLALANCADDGSNPEEALSVSPTEEPAAPSDEAQPEDPLAGTGAVTDMPTDKVYFAFDDYTLNTQSQEILSQMADFLKNSSSAVVQIEGHCDERGSVEYNLALGERRAQSVKDFLVQLGVDAARLPTISYGEERPVAEGSSEESWAQNRRAEFVLSSP